MRVCVIWTALEVILFTIQIIACYQKPHQQKCNGVKLKCQLKERNHVKAYIGPKLWNYLPKEIRTTTKIDPFKSKLKEWIWSHIPSI